MFITLMAVDDEPPVVELIKAMLEPMGCEVLTVTDSREAALLINNRKIDGFILDVRMPYVDGFQLTEAIRKSPTNKRAPIVMLTALNDAETMRRGFKAGITFFLGKPVSKERLVGLFMAMRGTMLTEKRRYARLPFHSTVTCTVQQRSVKLGSVNISEGGMLLEPTSSLQDDQEFDLEFNLPEISTALRMRAKVIRQDPHDGVGIEFLALGPEERDAVQRYISGAM